MTMKNGFSTINRLLGKQRDSSSNLSKSTTNLSVTKSTVNINDSSQLPQNRITPLPIATSNAPFEQTFRITVLLPRDQLYVARLGARVSLEKLLQLVCENKQLDADKYEFQHPADPSQIFSCDQTIGAVGLSEIRLCNKSSDNNNTFRLNGDNSSSRRNSFSSSKFSRNSKNISNTPSLYSSNYSLNSMGSSGVDSSNCRNISPEVATKPMAPVVPTRKKRLAPRPPSQNLSVLQSEKSSNLGAANVKIDAPTASSSSPDPPAIEQSALSTSDDLRKSNTSIDCNGNTKGRLQGSERCSEQCQETQMQVMLKSRSTLCIATSDDNNLNAHNSQPAPSPRRRVQTLPPKKPALTGPRQLAAQTSVENIQEMQPEMVTFQQCPAASPKSAAPPNPLEETSTNTKNVSRVFMFQNPHEESRSFLESTEQIMLESKELVEEETEQIILESKELVAEETCISKEPILEETVTEMKSPTVKTINLGAIFDKEHTEPMEPIELEQKNLHPNQEDQERSDPSWNSSSSTPILGEERKSFVESSSEDEEAIKVYDLKLGKTIVKTVSNQKAAPETVAMPSIETSHPANFLNEQNRTESPDLVDSSVVNGHNLETPQKVNLSVLDNESTATRIESLTEQDLSKQEGIINSSVVEDKLSIIQEIEKEKNEEPAKERIIQKPFEESLKPKEIPIVEGHKQVNPIESPPIQIDLQKLVEIPTQKAGSPINFDRSKTQASSTSPETLVKREPLFSTLERLGADEELEFEQHMRAAELEIERLNETAKPNLAARSSSFLSLSPFESAKNQKNQTTTDEYFSLGRRRSSSELSIGESPSLQSIGVIKSILLNSRKSGLNGSEESTNSRKPPPTECDIQSMEQPSPKSNNIFITNPIITTDKSKPRSAERIYRYSGPPNIQFSTWSERPKVQVAIKNEQDCVGDVSKNGPKLTSNDLALQRNGQSLHSAGSDCDLVRSTHKVTLRETRLSSNNSFEKEASKEQILRPKFAIGSRTSWAITTSPISAISNSSSLTQNNRPPLRPTSMMVQNSSTSHVTNNTQPIFGQGTLRKTGFKEKILASPDTEVDGSKPIIPAFTLKNKTQPQIKPKTPTRTETPAAAAFVAPVSVSPEAPPPPPIIRAVLTKQKTNRPQIERSISVDPRDQLLSAIRNFKRDELKNANNI